MWIKIWINNITFFECTICSVFYYSSIFETHVNVCSISISNNCRFYLTIHHTCFTKAWIKIWIGDFTFFKLIICPMFYYSPIFKTNIYIVTSAISNNSRFHTTVHHACFTKTVFCRNFYVWICNSAFFKLIILSMFHHSSVFKTDIYISGISISNNCGFHTTAHHACFAKSICFCCHKNPPKEHRIFYYSLPFIYVRIFQMLISYIQQKKRHQLLPVP